MASSYSSENMALIESLILLSHSDQDNLITIADWSNSNKKLLSKPSIYRIVVLLINQGLVCSSDI